MFWFRQGLCALPAFLVIWSSSTFIVSYVIALYNHDVDVIFPYISDTGANPPESCVFGLMTVVTAFAGVATMFARYKYLDKLNEETCRGPIKLNLATFWIGMASCLGMCFVATFQETSETHVHDFGALLFFASGILYIILQSVMSYQVYPYGSSLAVCHMRMAISTVSLLAFFPTFICAFFVQQTTLHKHTDDQDYYYHLASAVSEWIVAFSFVCYFLTYIHEFKQFTINVKTEFVAGS